MISNYFRRGLLGSLAVAVCLSGAIAPSATPKAAEMKKVKIALGTSVMNLTYPWLTLPVSLGYWKDEGYDVEILPAGGSLQAMQQMVAGNADFAQANSSVIIQANTKNNLPVKVAMMNGVIDWRLSVLESSSIKSGADMKGKKVGLINLGTGGVLFLKSYLVQSGLNADKDVRLLATGFGAPAVSALRKGHVDGLMYWGSATAGFQNAGLKLRLLKADDWETYPDYSLSVMEKTIKSDPKMILAIARGAAKATVFALANPECVRKIYWKDNPSKKPTGVDEATAIKWDDNRLNSQLRTLEAALKLGGGKMVGNVDPVAYERLQKFMLSAGLIKKTIPAADYLVDIKDFYKKINDFDANAVRAAAKTCSMG